MREYHCKQCGAVFLSRPAKFCSRECLYAWSKAERSAERVRICAHCGRRFDVVRPSRVSSLCSRRCISDFIATRGRGNRAPPPIRNARWVSLTHGMFALVDSVDFARVNVYWWRYVEGAAPTRRRDGGEYIMSRFIMQPTGRAWIDHRNGDTLDNRRSNLRIATRTQNARNSRKPNVAARSRFKGVSFRKAGGPDRRRCAVWAAAIRRDGRNVHLGFFAIEEDAARAYDEAARRLHGEFACVNFPRPGERSALSR